MNASVVTLAAAGVAGALALMGMEVGGVGGVELVAGGLVLGVVSEALDRRRCAKGCDK